MQGASLARPHMEEIMLTLEDDFMWITSHAFSEMRLLVEGALNLFEDDGGILCKLARDAGQIEAMNSLNDIGTTLYAFKEHIKMLQEAHHKASVQQSDSMSKQTHAFADNQEEPEND